MQPPRQPERQYRARLNSYIGKLFAEVNQTIIAELGDILAQRDSELGYNQDSFATRLEALIRGLAITRAVRESELLAFLPQLSAQLRGTNLLQLNRASKQVLGIDLFREDPKLAPLVESWTAENAKLINSLGTEYVDKVAGITQRGVRGGQTIKTMADDIRKATGASKARATTIARTETAKLNAAITEHRQRSNGINYYEWSSSNDERVRESHDVMQGRLCRWDDPTLYSPDEGKTWVSRGSGVGLHPGQDIQCRCVALPVFPDELER